MSCPCKVCHCSSDNHNLNNNATDLTTTELKKCETIKPGANLSKLESDYWSSSVQKYPFNIDLIPRIIRKRSKCLECNQEATVKYLDINKVPTPNPIIINQAGNKLTPPTTPSSRQVVHQTTFVPKITHAPYETVITIPSELLSPSPRKVVIEILPEASQNTQPEEVVIDRWIDLHETRHQIIVNPKPSDPLVYKPKNLILNWEKRDCAEIKTNIKNLGVEPADPDEYAQKYGPSLMSAVELPEIAAQAKNEHGYLLAADFKPNYFSSLEGDVHALGMIDLDKEGLSEYKYLVDETLKRNK